MLMFLGGKNQFCKRLEKATLNYALFAYKKLDDEQAKLIVEMEGRLKSIEQDSLKQDLERYLEHVRKPVDETNFSEAIKDFRDELRLFDHFNGRRIVDARMIDMVLTSELRGFFDEDTAAELQVAYAQLDTADRVKMAEVGGEAQFLTDISADTDRQWQEYRAQTLAHIEKRRKSGDETDQQWIKSMEQSLNDENTENEWKARMNRLKAFHADFNLRDRIKPKLVDTIKSWLEQSARLRMQMMAEYFERKMKGNQQELERALGENQARYSPTEIERIKGKMQSEYVSLRKSLKAIWSEQNAAKLADYEAEIEEQFQATHEQLRAHTKHVEELDQPIEKPDLTDIRAKFEHIKKQVQTFTPEEVQVLKDQVLAEAADYGNPDVSIIYKNSVKTFNTLLRISASGASDLDEQFANLESASQKEIEEIELEVNSLANLVAIVNGSKIEQATNPLLCQISQRLRTKLESLNTKEELNLLLQDEQLKPHLNIVSSADFANFKDVDGKTYDLNDHTGGHMVFYQRGDDWKFVINKDVFEDLDRVKQELGHELLHLEFENNESLKKKWREYLGVSPAGEQWQAISEAFIQEFPNKRPPRVESAASYTINDWKIKDVEQGEEYDDVLSEIYAMQKDLANDLESRQGPLSSALRETGVLGAALGLSKKEAEELNTKILGFDGPTGGGGDEEKKEGPTVKELESAASFDEVVVGHTKRIEDGLQSPFINSVPGGAALLNAMKNYTTQTEGLIRSYAKSQTAYLEAEIKERIDAVDTELGDIESKLKLGYLEAPNEKMGIIREVWNSTTFISMNDMIQVGKDVVEWWERRHKRKVADHAAKFGMALFEKLPLPWLGEFGLESSARKEKAEQDEVQEWQNRLTNKDAWELLDLIKTLADQLDPNRDQFKAVLRILAEKGRINWLDENIWIILNKLQNRTILDPNDPKMQSDPTVRKQKLQTAMGEIWDYDEFNELDRKNTSSYESKKKEHMDPIDKIQRVIGPHIKQLLMKKRAGGTVEPMEYEALIEYSIENGKFFGEGAMFYLIVGMAEGILTPDRGIVLDKHLNKWPVIEWIVTDDAPTTQAGFKKFCEENFGEEYANGALKGKGSEFKNFYWSVAQNEDTVIQRVRKSTKERGWDHDWSRTIAPTGDAESVRHFMSGRSGEVAAYGTGVENMYVGFTQWFEENAKHGLSKPKAIDHFARQIAAFMMAEGIMSGMAFRDNKIYFRDNAIYDNVARETGVGNHDGSTVGDHRNILKGFVKSTDDRLAGFYDLITDSNAAATEDENKSGKMPIHAERIISYLRGKVPDNIVSKIKSVDDVFANLVPIVKFLVTTSDKSKLSSSMAALHAQAQ